VFSCFARRADFTRANFVALIPRSAPPQTAQKPAGKNSIELFILLHLRSIKSSIQCFMADLTVLWGNTRRPAFMQTPVLTCFP
jgi:hypothetical protein